MKIATLLLVIVLLALAPFGIARAEAPKAASPRRVEVAVTGDGYKPDKVTAKPGEALVLVFKAAGDTGCCGTIVVPQVSFRGTVTKDKPLEVPVTMPASGKLTFACSMNMCKGEVAAK